VKPGKHVRARARTKIGGNGKVFISHTHSDNERCRPLLELLDTWGVDSWFDTETMQAGVELSTAIQSALEERDILLRVCTERTSGSYWMGLEADAFRGLQALDHQDSRGDRRLLINLILDDDYHRQPFDFATADVLAVADGTWQRELHQLLAVHNAFASRHDGDERLDRKDAEGGRQGRTQRARRALELPVAALALALALVLVVLAVLAVEATPLLRRPSSATHVPTPTPTPTPTATLVPTALPTPTPSTVVVREAGYSITLPYDWFPGPVQPIVNNGQVTGYFQQVTGPQSLLGGSQLQVLVFPNYTSTLQNFFSAFAIPDVEKESAVQQVTLSGSPCLRKDLDRYTDPQGNPQQPLQHMILLGCLHGGRAYDFQFSVDTNQFQAASQLYLNAMIASITLLD
jgi:TIR domain